MSFFASILLITAQAAGASAAPPANVDPKVAEQVPVIAAKLNHWRGAWGVIDNKLGCETVRSSGDEEIDALGCAAMLACVRPAYPELKRINDSKAAVDEKKRQMAAKLSTLEPCMTARRGQGIAEIALRRGRG